jgi:Lon protease-like protein
MDHRPPAESLPETFPIFPLGGALLLPRGRLPLNIFEPRYLAMTEDALAKGRYFGMVQPNPRGTHGPTGPGIYRIGCLGRLSAFSETDDGRYLITLTGVTRFAVVEEIEMRRGYRCVHADFGRFGADLQPLSMQKSFDRTGLLGELRGYFRRREIEANWAAIEEMPDEMLVTTLCMVCPFEVPEKQALLEAATETDRAAALRALLAIEMHGDDDGRPARAS